jgi:hypothetical protein
MSPSAKFTRKEVFTAILITATLLASVVAIASFNPLRRPAEDIRVSFLKATPVGSDSYSVIKFAKERGYDVASRSGGYYVDRSTVVGTSSMHCLLGEYHGIPLPFVTSVEAYWAFDQQGKLVDIRIRKSTDAL